jgi:hypothetical protein
MFEQLQPNAPKLPFREKLKEIKESKWFQEEGMKDECLSCKPAFASYAENDALDLFLGFAALCFHMARAESDRRRDNRYHQLALSVLIPVVSKIL